MYYENDAALLKRDERPLLPPADGAAPSPLRIPDLVPGLPMSKADVAYVTANATPAEAAYVADVKAVEDDCEDAGLEPAQTEDVLFATKIIAFADKFKVLHWAAPNASYHKALDEFYRILDRYKDDVAEQIQSIDGQFKGRQFLVVRLPVSDNPLEVANELKICCQNFLKAHAADPEYGSCRTLTETFLESVRKYVYLFRLCKEDGSVC